MNLMQDDPFEVKTITQTVTVKVLTRYRSKPNGKIETNTCKHMNIDWDFPLVLILKFQALGFRALRIYCVIH